MNSLDDIGLKQQLYLFQYQRCEDAGPKLRACVFPSVQSGGDQERKHKRRRGEYYSIPTSLIVAALKKLLPIGLNMCTPGDQELISLAKIRYSLVS